MKKNIVKILAIALIMCLTVPFVGCIVDMPTNEPTDEGAYAYVAIDINPSLELIVKDEVVLKVRAINDDANVLLSGEIIEGLSLEEATEKIVSLAEELGYLNEENTDVNITVTADSDEVTSQIEEKAEKAIKKGSEIAKAVRTERQKDIEKVKELKEKNPELYDKLTPAMNRIVEQVLALNPELTYEALMEMSVSELVEMLEELAREKDEAVSEEVKQEMENRHKELRDEAKKKMDELYDKARKDKEQIVSELEALYNSIKENVEENYTLTEEELNAIKEIVGKKLEIASLEDLEGLINELKEKAEKVELTPEQKEEIDKIKDEMDGFFDKVKEEFKDKIEESKKEFDKIKEQKREEHKHDLPCKPEKEDDAPKNEDEAPETDENMPETEENTEVEENTEEENNEIEEETEENTDEEKNPVRNWFDKLFGGGHKKPGK